MRTIITTSKSTNDALSRLIHRMNKSEKRAFKLLATRQGKALPLFVQLFDCLEKNNGVTDEFILQEIPSLRKQQLPNQKVFLYDYLLRCINFSAPHSLRAIEVNELISQCRILYDKCLYSDCLRMIDKARKLAEQNGLNTALLSLLEIEKQAIRHSISLHHEARTLRNVERSVHAIEQENLAARFHDLAVMLNVNYIRHGFPRNADEVEEVKKYFHAHLPEQDIAHSDTTSAMYAGYAYTSYYLYVQHYPNSYRHAAKWVQLFTEHPHLQVQYTEMYIRALNSMLVVLNKLNDQPRFAATHKQLMTLKRRKDIRFTENLKLNLFKAIYIHEINYHYLTGEFRIGTRIVSKLESELNRFIPFLDHHSLLLFYYKIACLYFGAGNHKRALVWLGRITQGQDLDIRADLHAFARILSLICHYELGNQRQLEANLKSLYRYLLKTDDLSAYNQLILKFIRKLSGTEPGDRMKKSFEQLRTQMMSLKRHRYEQRAFYYFDIVSWLESKITGKSLEEIIKQNSRKAQSFRKRTP